MAQANKRAAKAAAAWRLVLFSAMLAGGAQLVRQQREIDDLRMRLDERKPAGPLFEQGAAVSSDYAIGTWTVPPKTPEAKPVDWNQVDAKRRAEQHYLSGVIFFQKGDYDKARSEWLAARQDDPSNEDAEAGLQRLDAAYAAR